MNEKGLAIGYMGFEETQYPSKDTRPVLDQIQYITYILDNCATTAEVI
jgi:choloylglycine hydrolase